MRKSRVIKTLISVLLLALVLISNASAAYGAVTTTSSLNFRTGPSLSASRIGQLSAGVKVAVIAHEGTWSKVAVNGVTGYVSTQYIQSIADCDFAIGNGTITGSVVNIRQQPGTASPVIGQVSQGATVQVIGIKGYWFKVTYGQITGYIHPDYVDINRRDADASRGTTTTSTVRTAVVNYAKSLLNKSYVYGAAGPNSFDCSGFTMYVMRNVAGVSLPHSSASQYSSTTKIAKSSLLPGDLVFFNSGGSRVSHVGIYIGNNQFIHAANAQKDICIDSLNSSYYSRTYVGASRVIFS